jgi:hypothetical protein
VQCVSDLEFCLGTSLGRPGPGFLDVVGPSLPLGLGGPLMRRRTRAPRSAADVDNVPVHLSLVRQSDKLLLWAAYVPGGKGSV